MKAEHLDRLVACAMESRFSGGEMIFREGDPANRFYLIQSGKVVLESGAGGSAGREVGRLGAGDVLGWSWLFPPYLWHYNAKAVEPTEAIFFYGTRLREECEEDHDFGYQMLQRMAAVVIDRLQATRRYLLESKHSRSV